MKRLWTRQGSSKWVKSISLLLFNPTLEAFRKCQKKFHSLLTQLFYYMRRKRGAVVGLMALAVALSTCDDGNTKSSDGGTSNGCDQVCLDNMTSSGVIGLLSFLYNQNLAGKPVGEQDLNVNCPLGGTAHITGTNGYDSSTGIISINLFYDLISCMVSDTEYTLTFDGAVDQTGTLEQQGQISLAYNSLDLSFEGTVQQEAVIEHSCELALQERRDSDNTNYRVNGLLCGRSVSY